MLHNDVFNTVDSFFFYQTQLTSEEIINGAVFTRSGFSFAVIRNRKSVFVFDFDSQKKNVCYTINELPVLLELRSVETFISFIKRQLRHVFVE